MSSSSTSQGSPAEASGPALRRGTESPAASQASAPLTVDWLLAQEDLPALVALLPAGRLHGLLADQDLEDCAEILEWVRGDALVRVLDLDLWGPPLGDPEQSAALEVSASRFLDWVAAWKAVEPGFAAKRFLELDEQSVILIIRSLFEIVPVGLENGAEVSDDHFLAPDQKFYLKLKVSVGRDEELAVAFLRGLFEDSFAVASRILAYAAMLVNSETEEEALRFREGRLADEGFVSPLEARDLLRPKGFARWTDQTLDSYREAERRIREAEERLRAQGALAAELIPDLVDGFAQTLGQMETPRREELYRSLLPPERIVALLDGDAAAPPPALGKAGTEDVESHAVWLAADDDKAWDVAAEALLRARHKLMTVSGSHGALVDEGGESLLIDHVMESLASDNPEIWAGLQGRLARQANAVASLSANAASGTTQKLAARQLRAALNLGLEWLVAGRPAVADVLNQTSSGDNRSAKGSGASAGEATKLAQTTLEEVGVEAVFRAGLDLLWELALCAARSLEAFSPTQAKGLGQLVELQRYERAREMIWSREMGLGPLARLAAESLMRRFPVAPEALVSDKVPEKIVPSMRLLSTLEEWSKLLTVAQSLAETGPDAEGRMQEGASHAQTELH